MNICVNGQSKIPPGFRFHPTEEELLNYYLRKKVGCEKIDLDVIHDVDLNKLEPWDIQEECKLGSTPQNDWYFFSHKDKKYPTGSRTNRATSTGFWKATGRDKVIYNSFKRIGMRKTLVFYKGRAPHGKKSDWIMHEYRLDESSHEMQHVDSDIMPDEGWVVCRVFRKKNYHRKTLEIPKMTSTPSISVDSPRLDHILEYMGRSSETNNETLNKTNEILHLPILYENPKLIEDGCFFNQGHSMEKLLLETDHGFSIKQGLTIEENKGDWVSYDKHMALQLNGEEEINSRNNAEDLYFSMDYDDVNVQLSSRQVEIYEEDVGLWG